MITLRQVYRVFDLVALWASTLLVVAAGLYLLAGFFSPVVYTGMTGATTAGATSRQPNLKEAHLFRQHTIPKSATTQGALVQDSVSAGTPSYR